MTVERRAVAGLAPDQHNMRTHPETNLRAIAASLKRWGQQKPIVVDSAGVVRCGNGTLEAARRLGWTEIDVVVSDLSGAELAAFAIADNRTAELAEWSEELAAAIAQIGEDLPDLDVASLGLDIDLDFSPPMVDNSGGKDTRTGRITRPGETGTMIVSIGMASEVVSRDLVERLSAAIVARWEDLPVTNFVEWANARLSEDQ